MHRIAIFQTSIESEVSLEQQELYFIAAVSNGFLLDVSAHKTALFFSIYATCRHAIKYNIIFALYIFAFNDKSRNQHYNSLLNWSSYQTTPEEEALNIFASYRNFAFTKRMPIIKGGACIQVKTRCYFNLPKTCLKRKEFLDVAMPIIWVVIVPLNHQMFFSSEYTSARCL